MLHNIHQYLWVYIKRQFDKTTFTWQRPTLRTAVANTIVNIAIQRLHQYGQCTGDDAHRQHSNCVCEQLLGCKEQSDWSAPAEEAFPPDNQSAAIQQNSRHVGNEA